MSWCSQIRVWSHKTHRSAQGPVFVSPEGTHYDKKRSIKSGGLLGGDVLSYCYWDHNFLVAQDTRANSQLPLWSSSCSVQRVIRSISIGSFSWNSCLPDSLVRITQWHLVLHLLVSSVCPWSGKNLALCSAFYSGPHRCGTEDLVLGYAAWLVWCHFELY